MRGTSWPLPPKKEPQIGLLHPLRRYGFNLTKAESKSGLALRYGWQPKNLHPISTCREPFTVDHSLHCAKGGYTHVRYHEIRETLANKKSATMTSLNQSFSRYRASPSTNNHND